MVDDFAGSLLEHLVLWLGGTLGQPVVAEGREETWFSDKPWARPQYFDNRASLPDFAHAAVLIRVVETAAKAIDELAKSDYCGVIVDGELGDNKFDETSLSGVFVREHLIPNNRRFIRLSAEPERIPRALRGEGAISKAEIEEITKRVIDLLDG